MSDDAFEGLWGGSYYVSLTHTFVQSGREFTFYLYNTDISGVTALDGDYVKAGATIKLPSYEENFGFTAIHLFIETDKSYTED
ncbi:MAG: hypothetical protein R3Y09_01410 [Clostridia bacterium]